MRMERFKTKGLKNKVIRIEYVRYADDWIIGISGDRKLVLKIKEQVRHFMKNTLV